LFPVPHARFFAVFFPPSCKRKTRDPWLVVSFGGCGFTFAMATPPPAAVPSAVPPPEFTQCFWDLNQLNEAARVEAVQKLVSFAQDAQSTFERLAQLAGALPASGSSSDSAAVLCSDVQYAVKRYFRALSRV
jgi:hypothetical protein